MKKTLFALQVFGIIALFPIYVILEMNHDTGNLSENKNHPLVKENVEKNTIRVSLNAEAQNENAMPGKILAASKASGSKNETIKALSKRGYRTH